MVKDAFSDEDIVEMVSDQARLQYIMSYPVLVEMIDAYLFSQEFQLEAA